MKKQNENLTEQDGNLDQPNVNGWAGGLLMKAIRKAECTCHYSVTNCEVHNPNDKHKTMQNYEALILNHFSGTPREKYECLLSLEKENSQRKGEIEHYKRLVQGIKDSPDDAKLKDLRSIFDAYQSATLF